MESNISSSDGAANPMGEAIRLFRDLQRKSLFYTTIALIVIVGGCVHLNSRLLEEVTPVANEHIRTRLLQDDKDTLLYKLMHPDLAKDRPRHFNELDSPLPETRFYEFGYGWDIFPEPKLSTVVYKYRGQWNALQDQLSDTVFSAAVVNQMNNLLREERLLEGPELLDLFKFIAHNLRDNKNDEYSSVISGDTIPCYPKSSLPDSIASVIYRPVISTKALTTTLEFYCLGKRSTFYLIKASYTNKQISVEQSYFYKIKETGLSL